MAFPGNISEMRFNAFCPCKIGQTLCIAKDFDSSRNFFMKPVLKQLHQGCMARLSSDMPGHKGRGRIDLDRPLLTFAINK
jgi:hypothetical protein